MTSLATKIKGTGEKSTSKGCCLFTKKRASKLENTYNFYPQINELLELIKSVKIDEDKDFTIRKKDDFLLMLNDQVESKLNHYFTDQALDAKMKDEVDKYAEMFNAKKIVEKQRKKLEQQKININLCEDSKNLKDCIICMDQDRNTIFIPCLHLIVCETCAQTNIKSDCPECHKPIESKRTLQL